MVKYFTTLLLSVFMSSAFAADTVVYGFDDTGKNIKFGQKTNVFHFIEQYKKSNKNGKAFYAAGVGSSYEGGNFNPLNYAGKMTGVGGRKIVNDMYDELVKNYKNDHKGIVLIGYSRGAALAREFAHIIDERGDPLEYQEGQEPQGKAPTIIFMGLFDTVYSFGLAAGKIDLGYHKTVPSNVLAVAHATAQLEKRNIFDLWSIHTNEEHLNKTTCCTQYQWLQKRA
ncbi:phospholipase effector Tle1 domain-containing protein [Leucothrix arctica]|uniref:T6SS Phospholipase effector Tle1-like catalytic domain-containing protein n=1 Tax=Leucothrix arctica TaxID=1481894 RepID=A0A317CAZ5_9GAMM|nr:DUF2235 domain-containing protein [Leucothrix arctica]PWQ93540.1 hypothetical protein DKT75_18140 [Leucothrix arctica]